MPPLRCMSVSSEPISSVKTTTRVWPGSTNTSIIAVTASPVPASGFHPAWMTQPTQMPATSDIVTCREAIAMPIARAGGRTENQPNALASTAPPRAIPPRLRAEGGS